MGAWVGSARDKITAILLMNVPPLIALSMRFGSGKILFANLFRAQTEKSSPNVRKESIYSVKEMDSGREFCLKGLMLRWVLVS